MLDDWNVEGLIHLRCEVTGYQFPAITQSWDDWCLLHVVVEQGSKRFEQTDPALETRDLKRIRDWFEALAQDRLPRVASLSFIEPCIAFEFLASDETSVRFKVELGAELAPGFRMKQFDAVHKRWGIVFNLPRDRLAMVARDVELAMQRFPARTPPG